ncbi:uncharacterized protein B0H18DRAFT_999019 [Fomitopsis serialis]|uniref:uncharacterized protein n=1 Tax=Fomitopsis serialis TaxID=139415 RepID=UPI002007D5F1|nr:uncharacterized protein B0H18DRAFT_999019 [Neoantrodia serialis]KAH9928847.1 hypothetical protein B0H18DRAFT_999019 [Neoantrodia serialis]
MFKFHAGAFRALQVQASAHSLRQPGIHPGTTLARPTRAISRAFASLGRTQVLERHVHHPARTCFGRPCAAFSSSAPSRAAKDSSVPLDDVPMVENPTAEQTLDVFEGLARTQSQDLVPGLYSDPSHYCAAVVRNTMIIGHFLSTVDKDEFRSGTDIAPESPIARGRAALMLTARTAHRWMQEAFPPHSPPADQDIAEAMMYFSMNDRLMDVYEAGGPEPVPQWQDICDVILLAYFHALPALKRVAGPMPDKLVIYDAVLSKKDTGGEGGA